MKIDTDLRLAVRAACNIAAASQHWNARGLARDKAVEKFLASHPRLAKRAQKLNADYKALLAQAEQTRHALIDLTGLQGHQQNNGFSIEDDAKFVKAGGVLPEDRKMSYDVVMGRLATAKPADRGAILKEYGICWE